MQKNLFILLFLGLFLLSASVFADSWDPADDGYTNATELFPKKASQDHGPHTLDAVDTIDWYKIYMTNGYVYSFAQYNAWTGYWKPTVYDTNMSVVGGTTWDQSFTFLPPADGYYYLAVQAESNAGVNWNGKIRYSYITQLTDSLDPSDNTGYGATTLTPVFSYQSHADHIFFNSDQDWFKIYMTNTEAYLFKRETDQSYMYFDIYDNPDGNISLKSTSLGTWSPVSFQPSTSGWYYIRLYSSSYLKDSIVYKKMLASDASDPADDVWGGAVEIYPTLMGKSYGPQVVSPNDPGDYVKVYMTNGYTYFFNHTPLEAGSSIYITVYDDSQVELKQVYLDYSRFSTYVPAYTGYHYIKIKYPFGDNTWTGYLNYKYTPDSLDAWDPADNTPAGATHLVPVEGTISHGKHIFNGSETNDWYVIDMTNGWNYQFGLQCPDSYNFDFFIYAESDTVNPLDSSNGYLEYVPFSSGTYYVNVVRKHWSRTYWTGSLLLTLSIPRADAWDPLDDVSSTATELLPSTNAQTHGLHYVDNYEVDWYKVYMTNGNYYVFNFLSESYDSDGLVAYLFSDGMATNIIAKSGVDEYTENSLLVFSPQTNGYYYIKVTSDRWEGMLSYKYSKKILDQWDTADDLISGATLLEPKDGWQTHGPHSVGYGDTNDWFKILVTNGCTYRFYNQWRNPFPLQMEVVASDKTTIIDTLYMDSDHSDRFIATSTGTNYVRMYSDGFFSGSFAYWYESASSVSSVSSVSLSDAWDPTDDIPAGATLLSPSSNWQSHGPHYIGGDDTADWYQMYMTNGYAYFFTASRVNDGFDYKIGIYDNTLWNKVYSAQGYSDGRELCFQPNQNGLYYIKMEKGSSSYYDVNGSLNYSCKKIGGDAWDPVDDEDSGATVLNPSNAVKYDGPHKLNDFDQVDWYKISMTNQYIYFFELDRLSSYYSSAPEVEIRVYKDPLSSDSLAYSTSMLMFQADSTSDYYIKISFKPSLWSSSGYFGVQGFWEGNLGYYYQKNQDAWDPADDMATNGTVLVPLQQLQSHGIHILSPSDDKDWFRIYMTNSRTYSFEASRWSYDCQFPFLAIYSDTSNLMPLVYDAESYGRSSVLFKPNTTGWYYLVLGMDLAQSSYYGNSQTKYFQGNLQYCFMDNSDPWDPADDVSSNATVLVPTLAKQSNGIHVLNMNDKADWYQIYMTNGNIYIFEAGQNIGAARLSLFGDKDGTEFLIISENTWNERNGATGSCKIVYQAERTGVHYLRATPLSPAWSGYVYYKSINPANLSFIKTPNNNIKIPLYGDVILGDIDNDGDMDICSVGWDLNNFKPQLDIYKNNSTGIFTESIDTPKDYGLIGEALPSKILLDDFNNDMYPDLILTGEGSSGVKTTLLLNKGTGAFTNIGAQGLPIIEGAASMASGDIDNDGDKDLILGGYNNDNVKLGIYKNDGTGYFTEYQVGLLPEVLEGYPQFADLDNDGDLDITVFGLPYLFLVGGSSIIVSALYLNDGAGNFSLKTDANLPQIGGGKHISGDLDNDGDLDLIVSGLIYSNNTSHPRTKILINNGSAIFTEKDAGSLKGVVLSSLATADIDNDGDLDLFLSGADRNIFEDWPGVPQSGFYLNDGNASFTEKDSGYFPAAFWGNVSLKDLNGDKKPDMIFNGFTGFNYMECSFSTYINNSSVPNTPPTVPTGMSAVNSGGFWKFQWNHASDDHTPQNLMRYHIAIGTNVSGTYDYISTYITLPAGQPAIGNVDGFSAPSYQSSIPVAKTVYWKVCSIDSSLSKSAFCGELSTLIIPSDDTPPARVVLSTPSNNKFVVTSTPLLVWKKTTDALSGVKNYSVQISSNSFVTMRTQNVVSTNWTVAPALSEGVWKWRVRATDVSNNTSVWSVTNSFTLDATAGTLPGLVSPLSNSVSGNSTVAFKWKKSADSLSGITGYLLEIDDAPGFSSINYTSNITGNSITNATKTLVPGTWYWRVRSLNGAGLLSSYQSWIAHIDQTPPTIPSLVSPANNSWTSGMTPLVSWTASTDLGSGIASYRILVSTNSVFSTTNRLLLVPGNRTSTNININLDQAWYWKIQSLDNAGNWSSFSPAWKISLDTAGPEKVMGVSVDADWTQDNTPGIIWNKPSDGAGVGVSFYVVQIDDSPVFDSPESLITNSGGNNTNITLAPVADGIWYLSIKAVDALGNDDDRWSATNAVRIDTIAPSAPVSVSPSDGIWTKQNPELVWGKAADTGSSVSNYLLEIASNASFTPVNTSVLQVSTNYTRPLPLSSGTWYWRVKANDKAGNSSIATPVMRVNIDKEPLLLSAPMPPASSIISKLDVNFSWHGNDGTGSGASFYRIDIDLDGNTNNGFEVTKQTNLPSYSYSFAAAGTYSWRIYGVDATSNISYSPLWSFTIDTTIPSAELVSPVNTYVTTTLPSFVWSITTNAFTNRIEVSTNAFADVLLVSTGTNTNYTSISPLRQGTNWWRVALLKKSSVTWYTSYVSSFFVDSIVPTIPANQLPTNASFMQNSAPVFQWSVATDSGSGISKYIVQISSNSGFSVTNHELLSVSTSLLSPALADKAWYWRVIAMDSAGNRSAPSTATVFTIDTAGPSAVSIISPVSGSWVNDPTPDVKWTKASDVSGVEGYVIQVDDNPAFTSINNFITNLGATSTNVVLPSLADGTWNVRVRAFDLIGNQGSPSTACVIHIDTVSPTVIAVSPASGQFTGNRDASFTWVGNDSLSGVKNYRMNIDLNNNVSDGFEFVSTNLAASPFAYSFSTNGTYHWNVRVEDNAGNTNMSATFVLTVNTNSAEAALHLPVNDYKTANVTMNFTWSQESANGSVSNRIQVTTNGFAGYVLDSQKGTLTNESSSLADGSYSWRVITFNNVSYFTSETRTFLVDSQVPVQSGFSTAAGDTNSGTPSFAYTVTDNVFVASNTITLRMKIMTNSALSGMYTLISNGIKTPGVQALISKNSSKSFDVSCVVTNKIPNISIISLQLVCGDSLSFVTNRTWFWNLFDLNPPDVRMTPVAGTYKGDTTVTVSAYMSAVSSIIDTSASVHVWVKDGLLPEPSVTANGTVTVTLKEGKQYHLRYCAVDAVGNSSPTNTAVFIVLKGQESLFAAYPTVIDLKSVGTVRFVLPSKEKVTSIRILTVRGELVKEIRGIPESAGFYEWKIDDSDKLPAGHYVARFGTHKNILVIVK